MLIRFVLVQYFSVEKEVGNGVLFLKNNGAIQRKKISRDLVMVIISMRMFIINEDATLYPP